MCLLVCRVPSRRGYIASSRSAFNELARTALQASRRQASRREHWLFVFDLDEVVVDDFDVHFMLLLFDVLCKLDKLLNRHAHR